MTIFRASNPLRSQQFTVLSESQLSTDSLLESISHQAGNEQILGAATIGSLFFQASRVASLSLVSQSSRLAPFLNFASYGVALGAETAAFEGTHRALQSLSGNSENPNLWRWNGNGGLREGLTSTLFTIGSLKAFGAASQGQSLLLQHLASDLGMVASQNALGLMGWTPPPQGSAFEQLAHAEVLRLQLAAGGELLRTVAPSLSLLERNLELKHQIFSSRPASAELSNNSLPEMAARRVNEDGKTQMDRGLAARMAVEAEKPWAQAFERRFEQANNGEGISSEEIIRYLRFTQNLIATLAEHEITFVKAPNRFMQVLRRRSCPAIDKIYSDELGVEMSWARQFESHVERSGLNNLRREDCERYLLYKNWVDPRNVDITGNIAQDLRAQIELMLATPQRFQQYNAGVYDRRDFGLENLPDADGLTITDASLAPQARDRARVDSIEKLFRQPGTVLKTEELIWYVRYCNAHPAYAGEGGTVIVNYSPIYHEIEKELRGRGVDVVQIKLSALPQSPPTQYAREEELSDLEQEWARAGINFRDLINPPRSGEDSNTQAVTAGGIFQMLGTEKPQAPAQNPQAPSALAVVSPAPPSQRSLGQRFYDATLGRIWRASRPAAQANPSPIQLSFRGPFHLDSGTNIYRYRFPRGGRSNTVGRGWSADHRITGDSQLSRKHITIQRRIEPETTAYILSAHNLTMIHRAAGGAPETFDHGETAWLNPGDRVVLTPRVSFIFAPE